MFSKPNKNYCPNPDCKCEIPEPIAIINLSTTPERKYHGCPTCFFEIDTDSSEHKKTHSTKPPKTKDNPSTSCNNYFGYLANRPKDTSTPQECLVCPKLVECILKTYETN